MGHGNAHKLDTLPYSQKSSYANKMLHPGKSDQVNVFPHSDCSMKSFEIKVFKI